MSKSVNKWIGIGNVGKEPETKAIAGGTTIANFSLATTDRQKDVQGNWLDRVEWHSLVAFGKTAEIVQKYVHKGDKLFIEGRIQNRSWEKDGQKQYRTEIVVNELVLLSNKSAESTQPFDKIDAATYSKGGPITNEDIPF